MFSAIKAIMLKTMLELQSFKKFSFVQSSLSKLVLIVSFMKVSVGRSLEVHVDKKLNTLLINYTGGILSSVS